MECEDKKGFVYLIEAVGAGRYKIGRTIDLDARFTALNSGQSCYPLNILHAVWVDDCIELEGYLHRRLSRFRVYGEWFELPEIFFQREFAWMLNRKSLHKIICSIQTVMKIELSDRFLGVAEYGELIQSKDYSYYLGVNLLKKKGAAFQEGKTIIKTRQLLIESYKRMLKLEGLSFKLVEQEKERFEKYINYAPKDWYEFFAICRMVDSAAPNSKSVENRIIKGIRGVDPNFAVKKIFRIA